ncbi:DUF3089 domain-containing protein [Serratia entomophila]|uniref:DUF3089 domain-containing protein n=1 Tax=Serratia entomophila TaxID=42906 RepID=UPI00217A2820|nr:DUF3089 domain-containing protein [Serratia entomophila]CAI1005940.1 Protein of uncharacterised function (DUF3089) [Serratia entomophila]CAI1554608.1 Protein of uncharacterised function (DUF3089) [Serratia entomophila]CAI1655802.1 Protein of uncharacterised function (DUF3089) [Serratia entomophila]CAI1712359.1 Protein of uncharacterised function (DUF3089) [Serratia entomophila]CAI1797168.1 Protein of uncharacterised function (DUF3089) [Serratia entomophila]
MRKHIKEVTTGAVEQPGGINKRWAAAAGAFIIMASGVTACSSSKALPAPNYEQASAWFALPGRNGLERSVPPGFTAVNEAAAHADVFFVHPTTKIKNDEMNTPYDAAGELDTPVLLGQLSAFNGCCRLYSPQYRQASLKGISNDRAMNIAYSDIARAFRYYIAHYNRNRPFIIASHSQGTEHAVRLLQQEIMGTPLQNRLIVAYTIGAYTPSTLATIGLPTCNTAQQTGCIVSWNTVPEGRKDASFLVKKVKFWWQGKRIESTKPAVCINPLTWNETGGAHAAANLGALEFPVNTVPEQTRQLAPLIKGVTGARCKDMLLEVNIGAESSFNDDMSKYKGSFHLNDYGIFYANIRANANDRVLNWQRHHANTR